MARRLAQTLGIDVEQLTTGTPADAHEDLRLRLAFAELSLRNGDRDLAAGEFAVVLERARKLPFERFVDEARWGLGRSEEAAGHLERAIVIYEELLANPRLSSAVPRSTVSVRVIMAYSECGDLGRAVDLGEQALAELVQPVPSADVNAEVELISTVAGCYLERGDLIRAQLLIDRALARASEDGSPRARAAAAWNAAVIAQARHDSVGARQHADRALALYAELDNARGVALLRVVSAGLRFRQEVPEARVAALELGRAVDVLHEVGTRLDVGYARTEWARALLVLGELDRAGEIAREALVDLSSGDRLLTGGILLVLGRVAKAQGDPEHALSCYREAATALEDTGRPVRRGRPGASSGRPTSSWAAKKTRSRRCAEPVTPPGRHTTRCAVGRRRRPPSVDGRTPGQSTC